MGRGGRGKGKAKVPLRFPIGEQVVCLTEDGWEPGTVVNHWYTQEGFAPNFFAPYQVKLTDGTLIYVPDDSPQLCRERVMVWWERSFKVGGGAPMASKVRVAAVRAAARGISVDERNYNGMTALAESARSGWDGVMRVLLDLGASPCAVDSEGRSPLLLATAARCTTAEQVSSSVAALLEARADPNAQGQHLEKDPDFASKSVEHHEKHRTALHHCAARGYTDAARLLLEAAADPNIADGQHKTPFHLAIDDGSSREMVSLLLSAKSDPDKGNMEIGLNWSYLLEAARSGDSQLAAELINAKANVDMVGKNGMTPLTMAVTCGRANVAHLLLEAGCDTAINSMGKTAREFALKNRSTKFATLLGAETSGDAGNTRNNLFSVADWLNVAECS